jgi:hypothetical protein
MLNDKLDGNEAVRRIRSCAEEGRRILGIDGFRVVPDGHIAALDLILDLSSRPMTLSDAAKQAEEFVRSHRADDVIFEIVVEDAA